MKRLVPLLPLVFAMWLFSYLLQTDFERFITAYTARSPHQGSGPELPVVHIGPLSIAEQLELRNVFRQDEFWAFHAQRTPAGKTIDTESIRRRISIPTIRYAREGEDIIEEYRFELRGGTELLFNALIESYEIYHAEQVERAKRETLSRIEMISLRRDDFRDQLAYHQQPDHLKDPNKRLMPRENLERNIYHYNERLTYLEELLRDLEKVGQIISIAPYPSAHATPSE